MNGTSKIYYSISEVCSRTGLEQHVLRYWETEFSQLHPKKNRAGNRAYREKDIQLIEYIKNLLYEEKFTIPGAKKKLEGFKSHDAEPVISVETIPPAQEVLPSEQQVPHHNASLSVETIKEELGEVLRLLKT